MGAQLIILVHKQEAPADDLEGMELVPVDEPISQSEGETPAETSNVLSESERLQRAQGMLLYAAFLAVSMSWIMQFFIVVAARVHDMKDEEIGANSNSLSCLLKENEKSSIVCQLKVIHMLIEKTLMERNLSLYVNGVRGSLAGALNTTRTAWALSR